LSSSGGKTIIPSSPDPFSSAGCNPFFSNQVLPADRLRILLFKSIAMPVMQITNACHGKVTEPKSGIVAGPGAVTAFYADSTAPIHA
jgi:hypothetical protein